MTDKEMKVERYRDLNKTALKGQVVFTGSSLMEMFPINKLLEEHHDSTVIYNRAVGGFITDELLKVIDVCAVDLMPSKVFINIGTNDLSRSSIPISQVIDNYSKILGEIEKVPDVKIYLMAYYPVNYEAAAPEMKECLKKLAERHGQRYIDISRNLKDDRGRLKAEYTIEGMHIKEEGYRAIYDDIMKYVKE